MKATITNKSTKSVKIEIEVPLTRDVLAGEEGIQRALNDAGCLATQELLAFQDTDGKAITYGGIKFTVKGNIKEPKIFQTPYGECLVQRWVYQSSQGGEIYVPMEHQARIIGTSTPKFAKMVTSKYSCDGAPGVARDLKENHSRPVARSFIKNLTTLVAAIAQENEESWTYDLPSMPEAVACISIGLDGTCLNMKKDGWREAMCGTIAFFDSQGERMHTIYTAAAPEYGKEKFLKRLGNEVEKVKALYPKATIIGLADGAKCNWTFLAKYATVLTIDFWHMTEYLGKAAGVMFPKKKHFQAKQAWMTEACHSAKNDKGGVEHILDGLIEFSKKKRLKTEEREMLDTTITYLSNNKEKMNYYKNVQDKMPIGSGVTEAACKTLVKHRMCKGSSRWEDDGASSVLQLRGIYITPDRWDQFWDKYMQYGHIAA